MDWITVRIGKELKERIEKKGKGKNFHEVLLSLLEDEDKYLTESEVRDIVREEIEEMKYR